jgi:protease IV
MKDLFKTIFNILKYAGRIVTIIRNAVFNTIFLLIIVMIPLILLSSKHEVQVSKDSALLLSISGNIVEEKQITDPLSDFVNDSLGFTRLPGETLLQDILDCINTAASDRRITSIVLDMSNMQGSSLNHLRDIGEALQNFQKQNKKVIAAEDYYSQSMYFLASYADEIFLNPAGVIDLHGLGAYNLYFRDALEKLKINYHVFRVGTYKSAVEPITRNSMSDEAKKQNGLWLNALWQEFSKDIAVRRKISPQTLYLYTNNISSLLQSTHGDPAQLALETNLVDGLKTRHQLKGYLAEITGNSSTDDFNYIPFRQYLTTITRSYTAPSLSDTDGIGIIVAQGNILPGEQPPGTIGSDTLLDLLENARNDQNIRAVVLRIDSGGGSVFASEMIRREIQVLRENGKPVVVSMGSMAASGGYWIAAEADEIWAYPTTLTGSIGIFGAIPTFEESLAHLGIYSDGIGTTELAAGLNITRSLSPEMKKAVQMNIEHGYEQFLEIVANGRQMEVNQVEAIAEGRVFAGSTAKELGLVDKLGNLEDAIQAAADLAELDNYSAYYVNGPTTVADRLRTLFQTDILSLLKRFNLQTHTLFKFQNVADTAANLLLFKDPKGIYAHCLINYY